MTRVLIVDDQAENLYMLRVLLEAYGYEVDEARHGGEAIDKAHRKLPDLVISDLLMPVVDGYSLLRRWRDDDRLSRVPFLVYTATYTEPRDQRLAMALGADAFVTKPAEPEMIVARVRELIGLKERGELPSVAERSSTEHDLLREYNEVLLRKIEKKALEAEQANRVLREEIAVRRRVEEQLRQNEERFRTTFEQSAVGIAHIAADGRLTWVNDTVCRLTGYGPDELSDLTLLDLAERGATTDADRESVATLRQTVASGEACTLEVQNRRKDGTYFWNALTLNAVRDDAGAVVHFVAVMSDVTDRRQLEDQLRQAGKMEAVGRLAGGVAHDFNNLLTIICGCGEFLAEATGLSESDREALAAIREAADRGASLTRQLLGFSRQTLLQPKVVDLNSIVTETGGMLRRLIGEDVVLTCTLDPDLSPVRVDPGQLHQVLMNLAVNARDAMPMGGRLTIETSNVAIPDDDAALHLSCKAGCHARLAISDTGFGMTPDIVSHVFEPFFTTKPVDKGTGLGLAMVFGVVQQSGGCIHVKSEPNVGTTFMLYFPVVAVSVMDRPDDAPPVDVAGTETVLIVEDDPGVRALATRSLQSQGYTVLGATDGREALVTVSSYHGALDLVLTDVVMPNLSGPDLARNLQSRFPRLKVLFMSGYTDDAVMRHGVLEAEVAFIQKPYTPLGLAQRVRQVLDGDGPTSKVPD